MIFSPYQAAYLARMDMFFHIASVERQDSRNISHFNLFGLLLSKIVFREIFFCFTFDLPFSGRSTGSLAMLLALPIRLPIWTQYIQVRVNFSKNKHLWSFRDGGAPDKVCTEPDCIWTKTGAPRPDRVRILLWCWCFKFIIHWPWSDMWLWICWKPSGTPTSRRAFSGKFSNL